MKPLKFNFDLSYELMEAMNNDGEYVEIKGCYNNTFKAVSFINQSRDYNINDFKICYGFIDKMIGKNKNDRMYFRHAFLISLKDACVIDVTACLWYDSEEKCLDYDYYIFKEYDFNEYIDALISESGLPKLDKSNKVNEVEMVNKLTEMRLTYNPIDFMDLIQDVYGRDFRRGLDEYKRTQKIAVSI